MLRKDNILCYNNVGDIMKVPVGISARHIHLTKEDYYKIFVQDDLTKLKDITQPGLFACNEVVTLKGNKGTIKNVRILGPFRNYSQVEISKTDSYNLGVNVLMRKSGDLDNVEKIEVIGPKGSIFVPVILANRHIHISKSQANDLNVKDRQLVTVKIKGEKPGAILAEFKVSDEAYLELHLDLDDANAFLLKQGDEVEINI